MKRGGAETCITQYREVPVIFLGQHIQGFIYSKQYIQGFISSKKL